MNLQSNYRTYIRNWIFHVSYRFDEMVVIKIALISVEKKDEKTLPDEWSTHFSSWRNILVIFLAEYSPPERNSRYIPSGGMKRHLSLYWVAQKRDNFDFSIPTFLHSVRSIMRLLWYLHNSPNFNLLLSSSIPNAPYHIQILISQSQFKATDFEMCQFFEISLECFILQIVDWCRNISFIPKYFHSTKRLKTLSSCFSILHSSDLHIQKCVCVVLPNQYLAAKITKVSIGSCERKEIYEFAIFDVLKL